MDRLDAMALLVSVVETGGFSAAGRKLGVPLATVSRKLADLEAHLGTRLLVRTTRRMSLTETGRAYVASCKRILEQVEDAERAAAGEFTTPRGDLAVAAPIAFGRLHVLPMVAAFLALYPDITVRMILSDRNAQLIDDQIDMAVRIGPLPDSTMIATRVGAMRRVICASPAFIAAHGAPKTPDDLATLPCVSFDLSSTGAPWILKSGSGGEERTVPVNGRLVVNTAEAAIDAAIAGVGLTQVLSYQAAGAIRRGLLTRVLRDFEGDPSPVHLIHAGQGLLPLKMRSFLDFAAPLLRASLADLERLAE